MRSTGVPHCRQITAWQSPQTNGSSTGLAQVGQYNSTGESGMPYFAAAIDVTAMVSPSSVPMMVTFFAANFSGVFWSLSL